MKINICTISFRHSLISFNELILFARDLKVSGIELWYPHAVSLLNKYNVEIFNTLDELHIDIPMISAYINLLCEDGTFNEEIAKLKNIISAAQQFKCNIIRIFAGNAASRFFNPDMFDKCIKRINDVCDLLSEYNMFLAVETHPNTFADNLNSTLKLIEAANKNNFKINFDVLHLWEYGDDHFNSFELLKPYIINFHLKNITDRKHLPLFDPLNIYSPSGKRDGITTLRSGLINYEEFLKYVLGSGINASFSIEWFGENPFSILKEECKWLSELSKKYSDNNVKICN